MLFLILLIIVLCLLFGGIPRAVNTPGSIILLILLVLLIVALFGGLGPYSRWPVYP